MHAVRRTILKMAHNTKRLPDNPFKVIVEGNIGSGKTTFLNYYLNRNKDIAVISEPLEIWRNCNGHNLLELLYEDPRKWSFTFQSFVQLTMLQQHQKQVTEPVKMMERSIYSARYCFVEKMARDGLMPPPSLAVIDEWFKYLISKPSTQVDLIVYLRTYPEVAYERILRRNRSEENTVCFEYVKALHVLHEDWLYHKTLHNCPAPVIVLNANLDKSLIQEEYDKLQPKILKQAIA